MDDEPITLRDFVDRVFTEREKAFRQYMDSQKEALDHLSAAHTSSHKYVLEKINALENRLNTSEGAMLGKKDIWGYVLAIVGFGLAAGIAIFNRFGWPHP